MLIRMEVSSSDIWKFIIRNPRLQRVSGCTKIFIASFIAVQIFLPFVSGKLFPGYDTWTGGLYGHQWNMMVHNWNHGQIRISVTDKVTGDTMFVDHKVRLKASVWSNILDLPGFPPVVLRLFEGVTKVTS